MHRVFVSLTVNTAGLILLVGLSLAGNESTVQRDGLSGIYSAPPSHPPIVMKPGTEHPLDAHLHDQTGSENRSAFGTPLPPNHLTPAPILPFNPNRALSPAPSPQHPPPPPGVSRFGR